MPVDTEQPKYISLAIAEQEAAIKKEGKGDGCCASCIEALWCCTLCTTCLNQCFELEDNCCG